MFSGFPQDVILELLVLKWSTQKLKISLKVTRTEHESLVSTLIHCFQEFLGYNSSFKTVSYHYFLTCFRMAFPFTKFLIHGTFSPSVIGFHITVCSARFLISVEKLVTSGEVIEMLSYTPKTGEETY